MDDPRWQQFFRDPQSTQQRRYEVIRAVILDQQPMAEVATRFGVTYGTVRNFVSQFRACLSQGRMPPFSPRRRAADPPAPSPNHARFNPPAPMHACCHAVATSPSARAWPDSFCSCLCSLSSASSASFVRPAIPVRA
jgi:hypothetical protein